MTLPNEIDQDVNCPECGKRMEIDFESNAICGTAGCSIDWIPSVFIAAIRNQRTPGTTEIPNAELEALRRAWLPMAKGRSWARSSWSDELMATEAALHAILAHLPKQPDHVAELKRILNGYRSVHGTERQRAALEAAIEWGKKLGEKP